MAGPSAWWPELGTVVLEGRSVVMLRVAPVQAVLGVCQHAGGGVGAPCHPACVVMRVMLVGFMPLVSIASGLCHPRGQQALRLRVSQALASVVDRALAVGASCLANLTWCLPRCVSPGSCSPVHQRAVPLGGLGRCDAAPALPGRATGLRCDWSSVRLCGPAVLAGVYRRDVE